MSSDPTPPSSSVKRCMELVGYVSTFLGVIKAIRDTTGAKSIDDVLYCIGNSAMAVVAVALLMLGAAIWLSLFIDVQKLAGTIPDSLFVIVCVLTGLYFAFSKDGFSVERPWGIGLGAVIVISTAYLAYQRIAASSKPPEQS